MESSCESRVDKDDFDRGDEEAHKVNTYLGHKGCFRASPCL